MYTLKYLNENLKNNYLIKIYKMYFFLDILIILNIKIHYINGKKYIIYILYNNYITLFTEYCHQ